MNEEDFLAINSEKAFNNVRNGIWDLETFQEWLEVRETESRNDAIYYANL